MAEINTSFMVEYELKDVTAAGEATVTTSNNQSFGDIDQLPYFSDFEYKGILEHNLFVLDGSVDVYEDSEVEAGADSVAFFSTAKSDSNGDISNSCSITIDFTTYHAIHTIFPTRVRYYSDEYCN